MQDRDAAHRGRAALGLVALRALVADLLAEALPGEEPDQVRGEQDRDRERDARGDEDAPHATGSPLRGRCHRAARPPAVQTGRAGGLHQHDVTGPQLGAQQLERPRRHRRPRRPAPYSGAVDGRRARPPPARRRRRRSRRGRPRTASPELGHPAQHGPGAAAGCPTDGQRLQRRPHRLRVGVVGVVDHGDAVRTVGDLHPPPGRRARRADSARGDTAPGVAAAARARPRRRPARCRRGARRPAAAPPAPCPGRA